MKLPPELQDTLKGFSGPYASWFLHLPTRCLFDAGEGITPFLGNRIFAIENVFLSHSHLDHVSGLLSLLTARQSMRGPVDKPVDIYFPSQDSDRFSRLIDHITNHLPIDAPATWHPTLPGERIKTRKLEVEAFEAKHSVPSLGFRLIERRKKLKAEFVNLTGDQIRSLRASGHEVQEMLEHTKMVYSGDTGPGLDPELFRNCDLLIHEATFADADDRRGHDHSTIADALKLAAECSAKCLVLHHFSQRYASNEILEEAERCREASDFGGRLYMLMGYTEEPEWYRSDSKSGSVR